MLPYTKGSQHFQGDKVPVKVLRRLAANFIRKRHKLHMLSCELIHLTVNALNDPLNHFSVSGRFFLC